MTSSEDFKQAIRSGNISEAFLVAMSNAPELHITTKIITAEGHGVDGESVESDNYLRTHINLIENKIENEIGEKLTGDRYSEINQFHIEQVTQGHQTIQQNLISLQKMFQLMSSFQQQARGRSSWVNIAADVDRESLPTKPSSDRLSGERVPNALEAGTTVEKKNTQSQTKLDLKNDNSEPQLPSLELEEDEIVNDLLSIADDEDDVAGDEDPSNWSEWLDEEPEVEPKVFDLQSLNLRQAEPNWQNWEPPTTADDDRPSESESSC